MFKKSMKKIVCGVLALSASVACLGTMTACETKNPKVTMEIVFDGTPYTLEYKLYRKIAPTTTNHFLSLVENGYYDGLCIHDYTDKKWYTGAYKYANEELEYKDYYSFAKTHLPKSVWVDSGKKTPTYTLYGEFYANGGFTVESGALKQSFGSLTMYYSAKEVDQEVYIERLDGDGVTARQYKYNSATSQFFISLSTTETKDNNYCTFATLDEDSVSVLEDLQDAINDYIADNYDEASEDEEAQSFVKEKKMQIDEDDRFVSKDSYATYKVPQEPIVIKKVTVKKY